MTILLTGATGTIGRALVPLLAAHTDVRVLLRDGHDIPGVRVVVADLDRPSTLAGAMSGVDTLWLLTPAGPQAPHQSSNLVRAALEADVKHIVRLSAIGAAHDAPTRNGRLHALSDVELRASGIASTVVRPAPFMQNLLGSVVDGNLLHTWGDGRAGLIDARDIAEFAARVLLRPHEHVNRTYTITGPASLSMTDVAATLSDVLGRSIVARSIPPAAAVAGMVAAGIPEWVAEVVADEYGAAYAAGWGDYTTQDFTAVVGRPARPIDDFARDHAATIEPPTGQGTDDGPMVVVEDRLATIHP